MNKADFFWKNFRLGTELQISGTHIYNALYFLDKIEYLRHEEDIFEFLYNVSIGIERIQKITIILLEHSEEVDQENFEKTLITHNHLELHRKLKEFESFSFGKVHIKFLALTTSFYKSYRYGRYAKNSVYHKNYDKFEFLDFIKESLKIDEGEENDYVENNKQVRHFLGKVASKIVCKYYEIIRKQASKIGTFTHEIRYPSKAFKIFIAKQYSFDLENNVKKEILINLMNSNGLKDEFVAHIKSLKPLGFNSHNSSHYIKYLFNCIDNLEPVDEYEYFKEEKLIPKNRDSEIDGIGKGLYLQSDFTDWMDDESE